MISQMEITLNSENFDSEVFSSDIPVLVDFWATWCGPCRMLAPVIDEIAEEYEGRLKVCKVNVDDEGDLAGRFGIASIPTLKFFKGGIEVAAEIGYKPKEQLTDLIDKLV